MFVNRQAVFVCSCILLLVLIITLYETNTTLGTSLWKPDVAAQLLDMAKFFKPTDTAVLGGNTHVLHVLILTYMRSGSSLSGDILQQIKESFYVYEPIHMIANAIAHQHSMERPDGSIRKPPFSLDEETYNALYDWFTCNITKLPNIGLTDSFLSKGLKSRIFPICYSREKLKPQTPTIAMRMCARQLQAVCQHSPVRIIKTIRMRLSIVKQLLEELPYLKIIHLVRDPRATLSSQAGLGMCSAKRGGQPGCTNSLCKRLESDVLEVEHLIIKYPNRIMNVLYEDIARHPLEAAAKMYEFIGAKFTSEAESYVYNITTAGNPNNCAICTTRANSSEHVDSWKQKMKPEFIKIVNERCNYVIKRYKFDEFPLT